MKKEVQVLGIVSWKLVKFTGVVGRNLNLEEYNKSILVDVYGAFELHPHDSNLI